MADTLATLLLDAWRRHPERPSVFWRHEGRWQGRTARQTIERVASLAAGLHARGIGPGDCVALVARPQPDWVDVDAAALALGATVVGIYNTLSADAVCWQLDHCQAAVVVVEDAAQFAKIAKADVPLVVSMVPVDGAVLLTDLLAKPDLGWFEARCAEVHPEQIATRIYTSGTTGTPKAVGLSHGQLAGMVLAGNGVGELADGERGVIWLPLAHVFQRYAVYRGAYSGLVGYYARDQQELPEAMSVARPHVVATVPRMLEKVRDRVLQTVREASPVRQRIAAWAFDVGAQHQALREAGTPIPAGLRARYAVADRLVFRRIRERLGGCLRLFVCGGAALDPVVGRWFDSIGIPVLEGWGLTETSAPVTANQLGALRYGTVGRPLPGVELRVGDNGELQVRSPGVFGGYIGDEAATAEVFTEDGYFRTGDIGHIDDDGYVHITDRMKSLLVTAGGKNIAPSPIEAALTRSPLIEQAVVVGDGRPYLSALLVPDEGAVLAWAAEALPDLPTDDLWSSDALRERLQTEVDAVNGGLERYETIKRFALQREPLSIESDELTPTLKLRRAVVARRRQAAIDALYAS